MTASATRVYRIVYYGSSKDAYTTTVALRWAWNWRTALDPLWECWQAGQLKETLGHRAQAIADRINAEISEAPGESGRRFGFLTEDDLISEADVALIRSDLVAVQLATAQLSCLAVKAALKRLTQGDAAA